MDSLLGLIFAFLWSSATVATKFIGRDTAPLTVLAIRFAIAALILLTYMHARRREPLPRGGEWRHTAVLGFANSTVFLGASWLAIQQEPVGLYQLFVAAGPFLVAVLSLVWLKREVIGREWLGMALAAIGLALVVAPNIGNSDATPLAVGLTALAVVVNSFGSVYARWSQIKLNPGVLNGWQLVFGLLFVLPLAIGLNAGRPVNVTPAVAAGMLWVIFAVSIGAMIIWFHLVRKDPVRASNWLFLSPVFSYLMGAVLLGEPIEAYDVLGGALVLAGLIVSGAFNLRRILS